MPAGVGPEDPDGGVNAFDPANAANHPLLIRLHSALRELMHVPQAALSAPLPSMATVTRMPPDNLGNVELIIKIAQSPHAHAKVIGPCRLAIWSQWPDKVIERVKKANGVDLNGTWPDLDEGTVSVSVHLAEGGCGTSNNVCLESNE